MASRRCARILARCGFARRLAAIAVAGILLPLSFVSGALAQGTCEAMVLTQDRLQSWFNPHPAPDDFELPMQFGMSFVFRKLPLGSQGLYGGEKTTYTMGAREPQLFETHFEARVGSSISGRNSEATLLVGKYEVTKAQYVVVMGAGVLEAGIAVLTQKSRDPRVRELLQDYMDPKSPCHRVLTRNIVQLLAEPITFLSYRDYVEFIDTFNLFCISWSRCRRSLTELGPNPDLPGFVRLPLEYEWEFVARGGGEMAQGRLTRVQMQADMPEIESGRTILDYAHIEQNPQRLLPIGSRRPLYGFYDLLGNAQELMQNPFTAENGYGAVGAYVARGGHYRHTRDNLRVSQRVELMAFRRDDVTNEFVIQYFPLTGLRLMVGHPVQGLEERIGANTLASDFEQNYAPVGEAGDIAGNTLADARDIGRLSTPVELKNQLSANDTLDYFKFSLNVHARVVVSGTTAAPISVEVIDELQTVHAAGRIGTGASPAPVSSPALLPGTYFLKLAPAGTPGPAEDKYALTLAVERIADTGLERPSTDALAAAVAIGTSGGLAEEGYVGDGDRTDTYAVRDTSNEGGLLVTLSGFEGPLEVAYLDERQTVVARARADGAGGTLKLPVNSQRGKRGFVQVTAPPNTSSLYKITVKAEKPYDPVFLIRTSPSPSRFGREGATYSGFLDDSLRQLVLPIRLAERRNLRVELTQLDADAQLKIVDRDGSEVDSPHSRPGTAPEFFAQDVEEGLYFAVVQLVERDRRTQFNLTFTTNDAVVPVARGPEAAKRDSKMLRLSGSTVSDIATMTDETIYYHFDVASDATFVSVDANNYTENSDIDLLLEDASGKVLAKSANAGMAAESIIQQLDRGRYYIRVQRSGTAYMSMMTLTLELLQGLQKPSLSQFGTYVETHGDYEVYREGDRCNMVTLAQEVEPAFGWRRSRPFFMIGVQRGSESIFIELDRAGSSGGVDLYQGGSVGGYINGSRGSRIPLQFDDYWLKPLSACSSGMCVDDGAVRGFRRGSNLLIEGRNPKDNSGVSFVYSLRGYTKAAQRINSLCGGKANWVWNK